MKQFITIKEAGALTGKADITIRRLIKRLLTQDKPEVNQMISQKQTPSGYQYKINSEFLLKELKMDYLLDSQKSNQVNKQKNTQSKQEDYQASKQEGDQPEKVPEIKTEKPDHVNSQRQNESVEILKETISILREQLQAKDKQLTEKHQENHELIRGNREAIGTVNQLTQQLLLTGKNEEQEPEIVDDIPEGAKVQTGEIDETPEQRKRFFNIFK